MMGVLDSFSNAAKNFDPSGISFQSIFSSPAMAKVWFYIKTFLFLAIFVFGAIIFYKLVLQYKIRVTINSRLGGGSYEIKKDRAKLVVDSQGKKALVLFKMRKGKEQITCPVPASSYKCKSGKADHYYLWLDDNFNLHPIEPPKSTEAGSKHLVIQPEERAGWTRLEEKRLREKYQKKDMLEKYLPAGIMFVAMLFAFLIFFFGFKELGASMSSLASQFAQVASSCTRLGG